MTPPINDAGRIDSLYETIRQASTLRIKRQVRVYADNSNKYSIGDKKRDFVNKNRRFSLFFRRAYQ